MEDLIQKQADYESETKLIDLDHYQLAETNSFWICSLENLLVNKTLNVPV